MNNDLLHNPHAGEILQDEFLDIIGMSYDTLAKSINIPSPQILDIITGTKRITADIDLRLCRFFQLSEGYFLYLQNAYEIMEAKRILGDSLIEIKPYTTQQT